MFTWTVAEVTLFYEAPSHGISIKWTRFEDLQVLRLIKTHNLSSLLFSEASLLCIVSTHCVVDCCG